MLAETGAEAARDKAQADALVALDGMVGRAAATGVRRPLLEARFAASVDRQYP